MITTAEALDVILSSVPAFGSEVVSASAAPGRVLRQSIVAERDQPPFDRVTMDGIAIRSSDLSGAERRLSVQATQAAGDERLTLEQGKCIEIMTGASLPDGADTIIPVERIEMTEAAAVIETGYEARQGQFIHVRGSDHKRGAELLTSGRTISPMDIAVIASCGLTEVEVSYRPEIRVISTGNELVPAGQPVAAHQVRLSNGPAVLAMLASHGYVDATHDHLADDRTEMRERLPVHLDAADILILSGGVSMGKADYVPQVLEELGVRTLFHKISQRPGKPMWFGIGPSGQAVFALPGNPVSTLVCCRHYVIPALDRASGIREKSPEFAALARDFRFEPKLTCFLPATLLSNTAGSLLAVPVHTNTSGDFTALAGTDGYLELALEDSDFPAGAVVRAYRW